ncbi:MAG: TIGR01212 family radical SAM protein [Firmicutes bacterium]|nr:TIGR01212 family radical SAM protein [Bacillota bacterium]
MKKRNPFQNSDTNKRYFTYDCYLKRRFGGKVIKIPLDGGFTCPNIDGSKGVGGCIYCSKEPLAGRGKPLFEQFDAQRKILLKKWGREGVEERYIQYFQVFSNTYASAEKLKKLYDEALELPGTVGLSIATRADCIDNDVLRLLKEESERTYLTVELGLQTVHEKTAGLINRGHTFAEFCETYKRLDGLNVCIHIINGLPGETREMMLETAEKVADLRPHALKIHMLYIEEGTEIFEMWKSGDVPMLSRDEFVGIVCDQLEIMPPDTVIERVTGDGVSSRLAAPEWSLKKLVVQNEIDKEFVRRDSWQGKKYS